MLNHISETVRRIREIWLEVDPEQDRIWKHPQDQKERLLSQEISRSPWQIWACPYRRHYEHFKYEVNRVCGDGSAQALIGCFLVLIVLLITGGSAVLTAFGISLATCFGGALVINRFKPIKRFVLRFFKTIDLALFAIAFLLANTVFGFQVAAITGILISIMLITWKYLEERDQPRMSKSNSVADFLANVLTTVRIKKGYQKHERQDEKQNESKVPNACFESVSDAPEDYDESQESCDAREERLPFNDEGALANG